MDSAATTVDERPCEDCGQHSRLHFTWHDVRGLVTLCDACIAASARECEDCGSQDNVREYMNPGDWYAEIELCAACRDAATYAWYAARRGVRRSMREAQYE